MSPIVSLASPIVSLGSNFPRNSPTFCFSKFADLTIIMGNILAITPEDTLQLAIIGFVSLVVLLVKWKDLMVTFFDENHARTIGLRPGLLKAIFFMLLSASVVAAMQTVGAFLVIALVVTPGATAYLLCDRFPLLIITSVAIGSVTSFLGAYVSYFLDGATGGVIVTLQTLIFLIVFIFAPKYGLLATKIKAKQALKFPLAGLTAESKR